MKRKVPWLLLLLMILALWGGCTAPSSGDNRQTAGEKVKMAGTTPTPMQAARVYSTDMAELRANFNRDQGKVRLVVLLSPT